MAGIDIVRSEGATTSDTYAAPGHRTAGGLRSRPVSPPDFSLWLVRAELDDGATIEWPATHGDEAVFVVDGGLEVEGRLCPPKGAVIIEADAPATVKAVGPTRIVHVGPVDPAQPTGGINGAPEQHGHGVHVVGPRGTFARVADGSDSHYYADSSCPTCRITLLHVGRTFGYDSAAHSHTEDELIHVISGEIILGRQVLGAGDTLAIGGNVRYKFRGGDDGFVFVNYRRDASKQIFPGDRPELLEGGLVNGLEPVMDLIG